MKKANYFILGAVVCLCSASVRAAVYPESPNVKIAQQVGKCTGTVTDAMGPVTGATVVVKGSTRGVVTDMDGHFTIDAKKGETLVISYLGYTTKEIVYKGESKLDVTMEEDALQLDQVVVTALGIKREAKALGYAVTEMKGDDLIAANTINPVTALQGKVAGVEIAQSDGGMFGSTKIEIRGASTLSSNNQPIYVVDGIILDNASSSSGDADWSGNAGDYGNELKNLNPDDFETVSVLKGAAATALYGSRGLNGAVVITTKSGKGKKGLGIQFSQTFGMDIVTGTPGLQNEYSEGAFPGYVYYGDTDADGNYSKWNSLNNYTYNGEGQLSMISNHDSYAGAWAWGPSFDWFNGKQVEGYDHEMTSLKANKNNYKDVYRNGFSSNTNVSVSGGNETTNFYSSISYRTSNGTISNNTFNRLSFLAKASHKISRNVEVEASMSYARSNPKNPQPNIGGYFTDGTFVREYDTNYYRHKYMGDHGGMASNDYGDAYGNVPGKGLWWSIYENSYDQHETSFRPTLDINITFTDWLSLKLEGNYNYYYKRNETKERGTGYAGGNNTGYYSLGQFTKEQTNFSGHLMAQKQLNSDFEAHGFLRGEYYNTYSQNNSANTNGGLVVPNQFFIGNSVNTASYSNYVSGTKRIYSVAFQVGASWRNQLYLDVTGRNDWSSALVYNNGSGNYSYFYPSISGSWIVSETLKLPDWVSFGKVRASWAQVGNDTEAYYINTGYSLSSTLYNGSYVNGLNLNGTVKSNNLKPERKNSWEIGLDWRFINSRIGLDFTYYKENTKDQIMAISVPGVSGVSSMLINAGNIQNSGVEIALKTIPVKTRDFEWDVDFTYTKNNNKIVELSDMVADYIGLTGSVNYGNYGIGSVAKVGGSYGTLISYYAPKIDEASGKEVLLWRDGQRVAYADRSKKAEEVGKLTPDFLGSAATTFKYKNYSLYVALDMRFGGKVASYNGRYGLAYGFTENSLKYRKGTEWTSHWKGSYADAGTTYDDGYIPDGIFLAGTTLTDVNGDQFTLSENTTYQALYDQGKLDPCHISTWTYFRNSWGQGVVNNDWFHTLNYIALREVTFSYQTPEALAKKIGARNLSLSLTGRNLGYLLNSLPNNENPESVRGTSATEFRLRSYGAYTANFMFSINASF